MTEYSKICNILDVLSFKIENENSTLSPGMQCSEKTVGFSSSECHFIRSKIEYFFSLSYVFLGVKFMVQTWHNTIFHDFYGRDFLTRSLGCLFHDLH